MATFYGGMREVADHKRPWVRLTVDAKGGRLGAWLFGTRRRVPTYVFSWAQVDRIEPLPTTYISGPAVRFVFREPVPALVGKPNAGRFADARQPVFICHNAARLRRVLAAVPANLVTSTAAPAAPAGT